MRLRLCSALIVVMCLGGSAASQPPPPFTVVIQYPAVLSTVLPTFSVGGASGAPNSTVTVQLFDGMGNLVATKLTGTAGNGDWSVMFVNMPNGAYFARVTLPTGGRDVTAFAVGPVPAPGPWPLFP